MNNKKFASQVTFLILINLLVKLIWIFFIERKVQLNVGFENFGFYYSVLNFTLILSAINDPGLNNYIIQYLSKGNPKKQAISELFHLKIILSALYLIISLSLSFLLGFKDFQLIGLLILYQILFSFLTYSRSFLKGYQLLKVEIFFSVFDKIILIIAFIPVLYFKSSFTFSINFYVIAQIIGLSVALISCVYYLYKKEISVFIKGKISLNLSIIKKIIPFALFAFLVLAYNKVDVVMLAKMLPNGNLETGTYVAAYRFLDAASMLPILFATLFYPVVCKLIADKNKIDDLIKNSLSVLLTLTIIIAMASWFFRTNLMQLLYAQAYSAKLALIFGILMFSLPLIAIYYIFSTFLTANNSLRQLNIISASGLALNIGLNLLLIPTYQSLGAAVSSLMSFLIIGIAYLVLYHIKFKNKFPLFLWFKFSGFILTLIMLGYFLNPIITNWMFGIVLYTFISIILAILFRFFDINSSRKFMDVMP
nr:oligosaccharide flippase family protein [uncultured Pedobacter sp.]